MQDRREYYEIHQLEHSGALLISMHWYCSSHFPPYTGLTSYLVVRYSTNQLMMKGPSRKIKVIESLTITP